MALEDLTGASKFVNNLVSTNPAGTDAKSDGDNHIRGIKNVLLNTLPNINAAVTSSDEELNLLDGVTATTAELNILDGVTSTTAELNILDGVTSTASELNKLGGTVAVVADFDKLAGITASAAELNTLAGVTSSTSELNTLTGLTSTVAELNKLDGTTAVVADFNKLAATTSTATELNTLDGITSSTAELNILDGVTSTAAELNKLDGTTAVVADFDKLAGITSTVTELNYTDGVTSAIQTQLNTKATAISPSLSGTPTAPTPASNDNTTKVATTAYVQTELTDLIGGAPGALDTLNELAAAINDDASFASTVTSSLGTKAPIANPTFTGSITIGSAGISESELEILDGATLSTTELNKLDGVTSSTAELNILDGVTASTSELNKMDGVTATTTELNYTDGVTSNIQTQLNAIGLASWPINSIYTSISSTNPNSLFGGTWVAFGAGRVLVGRDSSDSDLLHLRKQAALRQTVIHLPLLRCHPTNTVLIFVMNTTMSIQTHQEHRGQVANRMTVLQQVVVTRV